MIKQNVNRLLSELPDGVKLVAAAKTRKPEDILQAIEAGIKILGENYVQEAERAYSVVGNRAKWHFIGHLQRNKVKTNRHQMFANGNYSEYNLKKVVRNREITKARWQKSKQKRNKNMINCQIPEKTSLKLRRK